MERVGDGGYCIDEPSVSYPDTVGEPEIWGTSSEALPSDPVLPVPVEGDLSMGVGFGKRNEGSEGDRVCEE